MLNPIIYAVPVFLAMMALEFAVERHRSQPVYRMADTISSLSLGILSQLVAVSSKGLTLGLYVRVWQHAAVWACGIGLALVLLSPAHGWPWALLWLAGWSG